jgi:hypothetical protein
VFVWYNISEARGFSQPETSEGISVRNHAC